MSKETAARIAVRDALIQLVDINCQFREAVQQDAALPAWVMKEDSEEDDRVLAALVSTRLTYVDEQNKQETARLPGIIGISKETCQLGHQLNETRHHFKQTMSDFRKLFGDSIDAIEQTSESLREGLLGGMNVHHLHFVQCYRCLLYTSPSPRDS